MPDVPPDPRAVINARIHHFKKQTQKLNLEFLEAEKELERAKEAVRLARNGMVAPRSAYPAPVRPIRPVAVAVPRPVLAIKPFTGGIGYVLQVENAEYWFDTEIHAINYAQDLYPQCDIAVLNPDGSILHRYSGTA